MSIRKKPWYQVFFKDKENFIFLFPAALLVFMQLDAIFSWTPFYGQNVKAASAAWWLLAGPCYAIAAACLFFGNKSRNGIKSAHVVGFAFFLILGLCALGGFNFKIA